MNSLKSLISPRIYKPIITIIVLTLIVAVFLMNTLYHFPGVIDDAYISFRYSANFAEGHGLVFNPGERVEGFSNFLWTLIVAIAMKLFKVDPMYFSKIAGFLISVGLIIVTYLCSRMVMGRWHLLNFIPPYIVAMNTYFAHWSVMGLATCPFVFLIFVAIWVAFLEQKYHWRVQVSPFVAAIAIMTRIDASFYLGIMFPAFWLILLTRKEFRLRRFAVWVLEFAIIIVPYVIWRLLYYESLFPNPYYAKVDPNIGHTRGTAHLFFFYFTQGWGFMNLWLVPAIVALFWRNRYGLICLLMLLLNTFYVWYVNGDWMQNYRFLLPVIPFIALNLSVVARLVGRLKNLPIKICLLLVLLFALYDYSRFHFNENSTYVWDWNPHRYYKNDSKWFYPRQLWQRYWQGIVPPLQNVADWIFHNVPEGAQVVTSDIGYPGFLNLGVRIIDIDGLTDKFIGRLGNSLQDNRKKQEYIMAKNPEFIFIFINHTRPDPTSPGYPYPEVSRLIYYSPEFQKNYVEVARMNKYMNSWVHLYKRKDARSGLTPEEKIERLRAALQRNAHIFYLYLEMIKLCREQKKPPGEWIHYAKRALRLFRGNAGNMRRLGDRLNEANQFKLAQTAYRQSLRVNPRQPALYSVLATLYQQTGDIDEAFEVLKQGIKLFPNNRGLQASFERLQKLKK